MRYKPGETLEQWAARVQQYEYGRALMRSASGEPVDKVMDDMSQSIIDKMRHPIFKSLLQERDTQIQESIEQSRQRYVETYVNRIGPRADHVDE